MLEKTLGGELSRTENVARYFSESKEKLIRRTTYFDADVYGSGLNLYFMSKKTFSSAADAFCAAWLEQFLWEEDLADKYDYSLESSIKIAQESFAGDLKQYVFQPINEEKLKRYIVPKLRGVINKTSQIQKECPNPHSVNFLDESGIYIDKKYDASKAYLFKKDEKFIDGVVFYEDKLFNHAKDIFFETDSKYAMFLS